MKSFIRSAVLLLLLSSSLPAQASSRILIFPFVAQTSVPSWEWMRVGLSAELELRLLHISGVTDVVIAESVPRTEELGVARKGGFDRYVSGSYHIEETFLELEARIVDVPSGEVLRSVTDRTPTDRPLKALDVLMHRVQMVFGVPAVRADARFLTEASTHNVAAFESYVAGLQLFRVSVSDPVAEGDALIASLAALREAAERDAGFAGPHYLMGIIHETLGDRALAVVSYRAAIERSPRMHRAIAALERMGVFPSG